MSLASQYQGGKSYLTPEQKQEVIAWLKNQNYWELEKLQLHIEAEYGIIFKSNQSYYSLFKEAGISWKKAQKKNPRKDPKLVAETQAKIKQQLADWQEEIESERLIIYMIDECHLLAWRYL